MLNSDGKGLRLLKGLPSRELILGIGGAGECVISRTRGAGVRSLPARRRTGVSASGAGVATRMDVDEWSALDDVERNEASGDRSGASGGVCVSDTEENVWES